MFDLFKRYVDEKYMKFENGQIWFGKERMILYFVPYSVGELFLNREIHGWKYTAIKFIVSRREGGVLLQQHGTSNVNALASPIEVILRIMNMLGMGVFRIVKTDNLKGFAVVAGASTLALETKVEEAGDGPVDFLISGLVAGAAQYHTKKPTYSVELSCLAQKGANECMWAVGNRADIMDYVKGSFPEKAGSVKTTLDNIEAAEKEIDGSASLKSVI